MARTFTLADLRTRAKERSDMENSPFISDAEWARFISASYAELYDMLVLADPERYRKDQTINGDGATSDFAVPSDYYGTLGVDYKVTSDSWTELERVPLGERNHYDGTPGISCGYTFVYNTGAPQTPMVRLLPTPSSGTVYRHLYMVAPANLTADGDVVDGVSGWEEYVVVDAAIKALGKEQSSTAELREAKQILQARIQSMAEARSAETAGRVMAKRTGGWRAADPADYFDMRRWW